MKTPLAISAATILLVACATFGTSAPSARATLSPASGSQAQGRLTFTQVAPERVRVTGDIKGHQEGLKGFHIHEKGDCSAPDAMSAGGHFNPANRQHASSPTTGHAGDMGNLTFDSFGSARVDTVLDGLSVSRDAPNGIIGRAVVVHMQTDDLKTDPTGNAGARAACGVIG